MAPGRSGLSGLPTFAGAVLCGGRSRRMGRDKASLVVGGQAMAARVADALRTAGAAEVFAVGGDPGALARQGLRVVPDEHPGDGPLQATITALRSSAHDVTVVLACDLLAPSPVAVAALVAALAAAAEATLAVVPVSGGHRQWTHAAWRRGALEPLEAARHDGARSLRRGARDLTLVTLVGLDERAVADADAPHDLPEPHGEEALVGASLAGVDIPEIDVVELAARHAAGHHVIDVREHVEFAEAHVPGARLIPLGEVVERIDEVPAEGPVYVICARGGRSAKAVAHYRSIGIDAVNVAGGTLAWIDAGYPTAEHLPSDGGM